MKNISDKYKISVVIPTFNRSRLLSYTLGSLWHQDVPAEDFEVIVADDGSRDDTRDVVRSFEDRMNVKYVFQEDRGYRPASARNKGIRLAEGHVCLFIDSGIILHPRCLREHVDFFEYKGPRAAAIGYVFGFERTEEAQERLRGLIVPEKPSESFRRVAADPSFSDIRDDHYLVYQDRLDQLPAPWFYFWTCHVSASKEDIIHVGLFDERYDGRWGVEDNDLGFRLQRHGVTIQLLRAAEAIHYPHIRDKEDLLEEGYLNCLYFNDKFRVPETALFLQHYRNKGLFDLNGKIIESRYELSGK